MPYNYFSSFRRHLRATTMRKFWLWHIWSTLGRNVNQFVCLSFVHAKFVIRFVPSRLSMDLCTPLKASNSLVLWKPYTIFTPALKICDLGCKKNAIDTLIRKSQADGFSTFRLKRLSLFFKMRHPRPLFRLFSVFFKQTSKQFYNKLMWKNVQPVYGTGIRTHDLQNMSLLP